MPGITLTNSGGRFDITELVTSVRWAGDCRQCARTLSIEMLSSAEDTSLPVVDCPVGSAVRMEEGEAVFSGYVFSRTKSTAANSIDLLCYDRGIYLKRNQTSRKYAGVTPEAAAAQIAAEFGIATGTLAATGLPVSRKFIGKSLYDIVMTLYTLAANMNGKAYYLAFEEDHLCVREQGGRGSVVVLRGGANLMEAVTTESIENTVNRVEVTDPDGNFVTSGQDDASIGSYGVLQSALVQSEGKDTAAEMVALLAKAQPEQKITVDILGDTRCVSGGRVFIYEPYTGLYGDFYIDSDAHEWKNGVYTTKLVLTLRAVMDGKQAGEALA